MKNILILITALCIGVYDGDTITILHENKPIKVRLAAVDCPEKKQAYGEKAKQFTSSILFNKTCKILVSDTDRYGRIVGLVIVGGDTVNYELIKHGLAWHYRKYDSNETLDYYHQVAKRNGLNIWSEANPIEPSLYRKKIKKP